MSDFDEVNFTVWTGELNGVYSRVLAEPDELSVRLGFADALDDYANGSDAAAMRAWAVVIRLQVAASLRACDACRRSLSAESHQIGARGLRRRTQSTLVAEELRLACACGGERDRQAAHRQYLLRYPAVGLGRRVVLMPLREWVARSLPAACAFRRIEFSRGMIDGVSLSVRDFMRHARVVAEFHPVCYYWLYDCRPCLSGESGWHVAAYSVENPEADRLNAPHDLPDVLWLAVRQEMREDGVARVLTAPESYRYLMRGCLRWARAQAGLPAVACGPLVRSANVGPFPSYSPAPSPFPDPLDFPGDS